MYKILLERSVQKFLIKHKGEDIVEKFTIAIRSLSLDPYNNSLDINILQGLPSTYRLRIGKYRFLYEILLDEIVINFFDAGARGDVYK